MYLMMMYGGGTPHLIAPPTHTQPWGPSTWAAVVDLHYIIILLVAIGYCKQWLWSVIRLTTCVLHHSYGFIVRICQPLCDFNALGWFFNKAFHKFNPLLL